MASVKIKRLLTAQGFDQAVELQTVYWGTDASDLVPRHMLHTLCHHGGHLLGAYDGTQLVGFVMGFLGTSVDSDAPDADRTASNLLIMSKRMLVLPQYRGQSIGLKLKLAQRDIALNQGIPLVTWTFDPLLAANAHLNLRKLGAISRRYAVNYFGDCDAENLTSDRLIVLWWVNGKRAKAYATGCTSRRTLQQCLDGNTPILSPLNEFSQAREPRAPSKGASSDNALLEIPSDIRRLNERTPEVARRWRLQIRYHLGRLMQSGYVVNDFVSVGTGQRRRTYYYLSRWEYQD